MQKKILIAIDDSTHARYALTYAGSLLTRMKEYQCTLMNVQPIVSQYLLDEARTSSQVTETLKKVNDENTAQSRQILEKGKEALVRTGVKPEWISLVSQTRVQGLAKDIIEYAGAHLYDAIVVGRRGLSRLQKIFMGNVSDELSEHSLGVPVWVVDEGSRVERLLVAVDGSPATHKIVDYICRICSDIKDLHFIFYHVPHALDYPESERSPEIDRLITQSEAHFREILWPETTQQLQSAGLQPDHYELRKPARTAKIGKMILEAAQNFNCETIVVGRRGSHKAFYFGSTSRYVAKQSVDRAVWLVV
ncbi:MAG: hypothetical protein VR64_22655 [Desulfatitalea sp. BRH_c12]|nr:MAG: hypothetical protein VR64_22655 [Desulfatitalea sp. BRH_c12]